MPIEIGTSTAVANATESAANTETVVGSLTIPNVGGPGQQGIFLLATVNITPGSSIASVQFRWRRASLTGTQVRTSGAIAGPAPAAAVSAYTFMAIDTVPGEGSMIYVLTYVGASEGAAATFTSFHGIGIAF